MEYQTPEKDVNGVRLEVSTAVTVKNGVFCGFSKFTVF
jgi:hypothetical protein